MVLSFPKIIQFRCPNWLTALQFIKHNPCHMLESKDSLKIYAELFGRLPILSVTMLIGPPELLLAALLTAGLDFLGKPRPGQICEYKFLSPPLSIKIESQYNLQHNQGWP